MPPRSSRRNPTVSELANLFGVRADDPNRFKLISSDEIAIRKLKIAVETSDIPPTVIAELLSRYLPSLLEILRDSPPESSIVRSVVRILCDATGNLLPQRTRGLHRLPGASILPAVLVRRVSSYPLSLLDNIVVRGNITTASMAPAMALWKDLIVLYDLAGTSAQFGSASHCNFNLESTLLSDFSRVARHFLDTPSLRSTPSDPEAKTPTGNLKYQLQTLLQIFGLMEVDGHVSDQLQKKILRCGSGEGEENHWCEVGGKNGEGCTPVDGEGFQSCSKCTFVVYCSVEHQRVDWKKHKLVCFKPSW